ncbi:MAG: AAA family ATPase [Eubacteriales bacterium]
MKLVVLFGPHAVGKMTVGEELAKKTGLKLFHNHMSIEGICDLFANYPADRRELTHLLREEVFTRFAKTDEYGMIFTFMWALDDENDARYLEHVEEIFRSANPETEFYYVELEADKEVRLVRNRTENRLRNKPSKRNLEASEKLFLQLEERYRLNSYPGEIRKEHYLRLNNTVLPAEEAAEQIRTFFAL